MRFIKLDKIKSIHTTLFSENCAKKTIWCNMRIFLLCLLLLTGCARKQSDKDALYRFEDYTVLKETAVWDDSLFLGHPSDIRYFNDWLLMYDPYDGQAFTCVHADSLKHKRLVNVGNGAGEVRLPVYLFHTEQGDSVVMYERSAKIFKRIAWSDFISNNLQQSVYSTQLTDQCYQAIPCKENYIMNVYHGGRLFRLVDSDNNIISEFGAYPGEVDSRFDDFSAGIVTQCQMASSPCGNYFVAAGYMSDMLSFYKIENNQVHLSKEYFSVGAQIDVYKHKGGYTSRRNEKTLQTYVDLCSTKDYVYALYQGCRVKETPKKELSYLQILDWNGNFIAGFRFDKRLFSIAVNEDTKTLYGLAGGETSHVYVYKLAL